MDRRVAGADRRRRDCWYSERASLDDHLTEAFTQSWQTECLRGQDVWSGIRSPSGDVDRSRVTKCVSEVEDLVTLRWTHKDGGNRATSSRENLSGLQKDVNPFISIQSANVGYTGQAGMLC